MKKKFVDVIVNYITKDKQCSDVEIEQLRYGYGSIYLQITKTIVITSLAIVLGLFVPYLIFTIFYNIIRKPSFGLHATKSWHCWVWSISLFILIPFFCKNITLNLVFKQVACILGILLMYKNSPADTIKKPIVSQKRRNIYKFVSTILSIIYSFAIIYVNNNMLSNCLLFALTLQNVMISPVTYKIFNLPYDNYKVYIRKEGIQC